MPWYDDTSGQVTLIKDPGTYSYGDDRAQYDKQVAAYQAQQAALEAAMPKAKTKEQFMATVKPEMLNPNGTFKAPKDGVNFAYEGMTPDQVYASYLQQVKNAGTHGVMQDGPDKGSLGYWNERGDLINAANNNLDAGWREGPDNGGGFLGGITRAATSMAKGIASNPALMAAITAGVAPALSSSIGQATNLGTAASNAAASGIINGARTLATGGNIGDVVKGAAMSTAGGMAGNYVGNAVGTATGSQVAAKIAGDLAKSAVSGKDLASTLVTSGMNAAVSEITDAVPGFKDLSDTQKGIIGSAIAASLKGKNITTAVVSDLINQATEEVAKAKSGGKTQAKTGGWA